MEVVKPREYGYVGGSLLYGRVRAEEEAYSSYEETKQWLSDRGITLGPIEIIETPGIRPGDPGYVGWHAWEVVNDAS